MLSSRRTLEPRSLQSSTSRTIVLSQSSTARSPPSSRLSLHRGFFWGSKQKNTTSRAGKVCKGSSTQDFAGQDLTRKQLYRSVFWGNHHLRRYLPRYAPIHEWRFSSSLGKKPETIFSSRNKAEVNDTEEEDWYTQWEKKKLRQYNDFMKKVEHDPYTALFGKTWNFAEDNIEPRAATNPSPAFSKDTSIPNDKRTSENWASQSNPSSTKTSEDRDNSGSPSNSKTTPIREHDQEYEIDPITNRKVLKASAAPVATFGHDKSQAEGGERTFGPFLKRWNLVSPAPSDRRFLMVEHAQVLSSSDSPSKDTPPVKPHSSDGWLAREGFGESHKHKEESRPTIQGQDAKPKTTATKIESALDRHLGNKSTNEKRSSDRQQLQYESEENKTEDIDLLRPSDVRASAGLRGNPPKETDVDKQARRKKLEEKYKSCSPDRANHSAGGLASNRFAQKREDRPVQDGTAPELGFGAWLKGTLQDSKLTSEEVSRGTSAVWVNELSDARDFDPTSADQRSHPTLLSKDESVSERSNIVAPKAHETEDKATKLKAQIVPFKAKLDAMKADYDFLRQQWLEQLRLMRKKAAKKEEEMKAQKIAKRASEIHEEEIKTQKVAMEAMEMRSSDRTTSSAKTKSIGNNDAEKPAPRRLQSFLQGEGDMASNVHEFAGRDRWYKRKAPHAMDAKDAEMDAKLQRLATDRALIREIRNIYEDTYGTIDTKHRQSHVLSSSPTKKPDQPIRSSSGRVDSHAQLPSSAGGIIETSKGLELPETLVIIQKLFGHLREAQSAIEDYPCQEDQASDLKNQDTTSRTITESAMQIIITASQLARIGRSGMISRGSIKATAASRSEQPLVNRPRPTATPECTNLEIQNATELNTYCILAYDSVAESVKSVECSTLAPFSKEESLLPSEALARLSNPGNFLSHVISLVEKGYKPVSGTSDILVFKKRATPPDSAETKKPDARKEPNHIGRSLDPLPVILDGSAGTQGGSRPLELPSQANIEEHREAQLGGIEAEKQKVKEDQEVEKSSKTATDDIMKEKQAFEEAQKQESASSASPSQTSRDTVHRQERVFSGSRQGRWIDNSAKSKRRRRAAGRRRRTIGNVLLAGAFTAACCYSVGVVSERMHGL